MLTVMFRNCDIKITSRIARRLQLPRRQVHQVALHSAPNSSSNQQLEASERVLPLQPLDSKIHHRSGAHPNQRPVSLALQNPHRLSAHLQHPHSELKLPLLLSALANKALNRQPMPLDLLHPLSVNSLRNLLLVCLVARLNQLRLVVCLVSQRNLLHPRRLSVDSVPRRLHLNREASLSEHNLPRNLLQILSGKRLRRPVSLSVVSIRALRGN